MTLFHSRREETEQERGWIGEKAGGKERKKTRLVKLKNLNRRRQRRGSMTDIGGGQPDGMY